MKSTKKGGLTCDDCLGYKSLKICSYTVASALKTGDIHSYLRWYKGLKAKPSFTNLAEHGKPSSTGKKPRKGAPKKISKQISHILQDASEREFSSRITVDPLHNSSQRYISHDSSQVYSFYGHDSSQKFSHSSRQGFLQGYSSSGQDSSHSSGPGFPQGYSCSGQDSLHSFSQGYSSSGHDSHSSDRSFPQDYSCSGEDSLQSSGQGYSSSGHDSHSSNQNFPQGYSGSVQDSSHSSHQSLPQGYHSLGQQSSVQCFSLPSHSSPLYGPQRCPTLQGDGSLMWNYGGFSHSTQVQAHSPLVFSSSPISIQNYGFSSVGTCATGPPPLIHAPTLSTATSVSPGIYSLTGYPLTPQQPRNLPPSSRPLLETPFWVCFVRGNISRCNGCKGRIARNANGKPLPPLDNLVLRHQEYVLFQNPNTGTFQQSAQPRNVYYHPWKTCIAPYFANFQAAQHIRCDREVKLLLSPVHTQLLKAEFGVDI